MSLDIIAPETDTIPGRPPAEVLAAVAAAWRNYDRLLACGRELRFEVDGQTSEVTVQVLDDWGSVLETISLSQALEVAATAQLDPNCERTT